MLRLYRYGLATLALSMLAACSSSSEEQDESPDAALELELRSTLEELAKETGTELREVTPITDAEGRLGYVRGLLSEDGKLSRKVAVYRDGTLMSIEEAQARLDQEHREKWGKVTRIGVQAILSSPPGAVLPFFLVYLEDSCQGPLRSGLEEFARGIVEIEDQMGFEATGDATVEFSRRDCIHLVSSNAQGSIRPDVDLQHVNQAAGGSAQTIYHHGADGDFATGVKVAVLEPMSNGATNECPIHEGHQAFDFTSGSEYTGSTAGGKDSCHRVLDPDCSVCDVGTVSGYCRNGTCRTRHATWTASRIQASVDGTRGHAAEVQLHFDRSVTGALTPITYRQALNRMESLDVHFINESFSTPPPQSFDGFDLQRDLFLAEHRDTLIFKSAGNTSSCSGEQDADCEALNAICVGSADASGSLRDPRDDVMACSSNWQNPKFAGTTTRKDAERPDVVQHGKDVFGAAEGGTDWRTISGTSFSTPVVTGLAALYYDSCGPSLIRNHTFRTRLKLRADYSPTLDPTISMLYPTPGQSADAKAGAGIPLAHNFRCSSSGTDSPSTSHLPPIPSGDNSGPVDPIDVDFASGGDIPDPPPPGSPPPGEPVPPWMLAATPAETDPTTDADYDPDQLYGEAVAPLRVATEASGLRQAGPNLRRLKMGSSAFAGGLKARVRAVASFYTCPSASSTDVAPQNDYDIAVCSEAKEKCYGISESVDDNSEGFDVIIDDNVQQLDLWLIFDSNLTGCPVATPGLGSGTTRWFTIWNPPAP